MVSAGSALHEERTFFFFPSCCVSPKICNAVCAIGSVSLSLQRLLPVYVRAPRVRAPSVLLKGGPVFSTLVLMERELLKRDSGGSSNGLTLKEVSARDGRADGEIQENFSAVSSVLQGVYSSALPQRNALGLPVLEATLPRRVLCWVGSSLLWPTRAATDLYVVKGYDGYSRSRES